MEPPSNFRTLPTASANPRLKLQLDDLITAAEARCHHQLQNKSADAP